MANRPPPQPLTKVNAERLLKKDLERNKQRAEARKAAKQAKLDQAAAAKQALIDEATANAAKRQAEDHANAIEAMVVDFAATIGPEEAIYEPAGSGTPSAKFVVYLAEQGLAPDGSPLVDPDAKQSRAAYDGPMVALKTARLTYVTAKNGILCNGDELATLCGQFQRDHTVRALIKALKLDFNPYVSLNPGQQSMNLRNKARHALKAGTLKLAEVKAAYEATKGA